MKRKFLKCLKICSIAIYGLKTWTARQKEREYNIMKALPFWKYKNDDPSNKGKVDEERSILRKQRIEWVTSWGEGSAF